DDDLAIDLDELITAPLRIDRHDFRRNRIEVNALTRHAGADADREVHVLDRLDMLAADHARDLGALLSREVGMGAGLTGGGLLGRRLVGLGGLVAFAAHVVITALGLHVLVLALATLGLHVFVAAFA